MRSVDTLSVGSGSFTTFGPYALDNRPCQMAVEVENDGPQALTNFVIQVRDDDTGEFYQLKADTDFATTDPVLTLSSATRVNTLANGSRSHFWLNLPGLSAIQFLAKGAGTSALTIRTNSK